MKNEKKWQEVYIKPKLLEFSSPTIPCYTSQPLSSRTVTFIEKQAFIDLQSENKALREITAMQRETLGNISSVTKRNMEDRPLYWGGKIVGHCIETLAKTDKMMKGIE